MYLRIFQVSILSGILILLFSFSGHPDSSRRIFGQNFKTLKINIDSAGLDTLSLDEMKKLTMDDVDSMTVNTERTRAYVKLKNGRHYVVIISDDLRKNAETKYGSNVSRTYHYNRTDSLDVDSTDYDKIFTKTEIESEFPGGVAAWYRFLGKNLVYPDQAIANEIQGQVVTRFIVDQDGYISDIEIVSGPPALWQACINVIKKSGKWVPAIQNGKRVKSYKSQPINFKMERH